MTERRRLGHRPGLDGLRGVAVALVVAAHFGLGPVFTGGGGVTLFLVLSGYLISRLLLEHQERDGGTVRLGAFYGRRFRRLLPALLAVLPVYAVVTEARGQDWLTGLLASVTYTTNYVFVENERIGPFAGTWSLAIEEHFYLLWPLVVIVSGRRLFHVAVIGAVGVAVLRTALVLDGAVYQEVYHWTHTRADGLLVGCALGVAAHRGRVWLPSRVLVAAGAVVLAAYSIAMESPGDRALWGITASVAGCAVLVAAGAERPGRLLTCAPLRYLGRISYSLYLWHFAVWWTLGRGVGPLMVSVVLAHASVALIENRFRTPHHEVPRRPSRIRALAGDT